MRRTVDELVVEVGQDLLELRRVLARERDHDLVERPAAQDLLHRGVRPEHLHALDRLALARGVVRDRADDAEAGLGVRVDRGDDLGGEVARARDQHVAQVVAAAAERAEETAAGDAARDERAGAERAEERDAETAVVRAERRVRGEHRDDRHRHAADDQPHLAQQRAGAVRAVEAARAEHEEDERKDRRERRHPVGEARPPGAGRLVPEDREAEAVGGGPAGGHQQEIRQHEKAAEDLAVPVEHLGAPPHRAVERPDLASSASSAAKSIWLGPSQGAASGSGCASTNSASMPTRDRGARERRDDAAVAVGSPSRRRPAAARRAWRRSRPARSARISDQPAEVDDEVVVAEGRAALGDEHAARAAGDHLLDRVAHVARRHELALLDVDGQAGRGAGHEQVGLPAQEGRHLQAVDDLRDRLGLARARGRR